MKIRHSIFAFGCASVAGEKCFKPKKSPKLCFFRHCNGTIGINSNKTVIFSSRCRHPGCQKAFSQLSNLQSHSRCHQTDKPYKCNSCYKCFSDEPSLLEHIPKHKESKHLKTHICQYCGKSYTQETYLSKHMQKHAERTDKRPPIGAALGELRKSSSFCCVTLGFLCHLFQKLLK